MRHRGRKAPTYQTSMTQAGFCFSLVTVRVFEPILAIFMEHVVNNCKFGTDRRGCRTKSPFLRFCRANHFRPQPLARHRETKRFSGAILRALTLSCLFLGPSMPVANVMAADPAHQLNRAIDQQKSALNETRTKQDRLRQALRTNQQKLDEIEQAQNALEDKISGIEEKIDQLDAQKRSLAAQIVQLRPEIANNLRIAYSLGDQATLGAMLAHTDALTTERNLHYIKALISSALGKMRELKQAEQNQITNQAALKANHDALVHAHEALAETLTQQQTQRAEQNRLLAVISTQVDQQSQHLAELLSQKKALDTQIARINAAAAETERLRAARRAQVAAEQRQSGKNTADERPIEEVDTGRVEPGSSGIIPVRGKIIRPYGAPIAEGDMRAQGILFSAPADTPFRAVAAGKVVFAGTMKGWGELVIIRHTNGYLSLYAHASELRVRTGMRVSQGTELGKCGQIEGRTTGLYFEVRRGNDTINPLRWSAYRTARQES